LQSKQTLLPAPINFKLEYIGYSNRRGIYVRLLIPTLIGTRVCRCLFYQAARANWVSPVKAFWSTFKVACRSTTTC